ASATARRGGVRRARSLAEIVEVLDLRATSGHRRRRRHECEHMLVRWSNLTLEAEEQRRLPGYRDEAVVRRFDAPEALETRFYEVRAKSVLNRVPAASRMPFSWTINPYRGCSISCIYCFARP